MRRILFEIPLHHLGLPDLPVYAYGFMLMLGFLAAIALAVHYGKRDGLAPEAIYNLSFLAVISGIVGARLLWLLLFAPATYWAAPFWERAGTNLLRAVAVWNGGLVFYGGLLLALAAGLLYARRHRLPLARTADAFAPGVAAGLAFGRVGCFLNGCCYGRTCPVDAWYGVRFPPASPAAEAHYFHGLTAGGASLPVYPAQLLASALGVALLALLVWLYPRRRFPGQLILTFVMLYALGRFGLEFVRGDTPAFLGETLGRGLKAGQIVALVTFLAAGAVLAVLWRRHRAPEKGPPAHDEA
jgi:phosphatidylglycerol:prolipoprotein diacylglycerol transferase